MTVTAESRATTRSGLLIPAGVGIAGSRLMGIALPSQRLLDQISDLVMPGNTGRMSPKTHLQDVSQGLGPTTAVEAWGRPREDLNAVPIRFPRIFTAEINELAVLGTPPPLTGFTQR